MVEQRRIAAGMTHAHLAERVGVAAVTGPIRLWLDRDHDTVRLGLLERLCQVLDLHPVELFTVPTRAHARRTLVPVEMPSDGQVVEAALATLGTATPTASGQSGPVSRADLATALGWPLGRLTAALAHLDDALDERGVRVDVGAGMKLQTRQTQHHRRSEAWRCLNRDKLIIYIAPYYDFDRGWEMQHRLRRTRPE